MPVSTCKEVMDLVPVSRYKGMTLVPVSPCKACADSSSQFEDVVA